MKKDYSELSYEELRELAVKGELEHDKMTESVYEYLLKREAEVANKDPTVIEICTAGLKKYERYKDFDGFEIYLQFLYTNSKEKSEKKQIEEIERKVLEQFYRKPNPIAGVAFLITVSLLAVTVVAAAGYGVVSLGRRLLDTPEKTVITDDRGIDIIRTEDTRVYSSINEMLEAEKLKIFYPAKLPNGYTFTNFEFKDFGTYEEAWAYTSEPSLLFRVEIGTGQTPPDSYLYETNGIKYGIIELEDDLYQADWFSDDGNDYYSITVSNQAVISEIIENLKES